MGKRGMGKRGTCPPENVKKCFFLLQMLFKTLVDEAFMHSFEKMSSASRGFAPDPTGKLPLEGLDPAGGLPSYRTP